MRACKKGLFVGRNKGFPGIRLGVDFVEKSGCFLIVGVDAAAPDFFLVSLLSGCLAQT